jgi:hypothetical protein
MRHYFRYKGGYINIDDENIYLTTTGNWQETSVLKEQKKKNYQRQLNFLLWAIFGLDLYLCI